MVGWGFVLGSQQADRLQAKPCCGQRAEFQCFGVENGGRIIPEEGEGGNQSPCARDIVTFLQVLETGPPVYFGTDRPQGPRRSFLPELPIFCSLVQFSLFLWIYVIPLRCTVEGGKMSQRWSFLRCKLFTAAKCLQRITNGMSPIKGRGQTGPGVRCCTMVGTGEAMDGASCMAWARS